MSDVFENEMNYRSRLKAELAKVEGHLRRAEELLKAPEPVIDVVNGASADS